MSLNYFIMWEEKDWWVIFYCRMLNQVFHSIMLTKNSSRTHHQVSYDHDQHKDQNAKRLSGHLHTIPHGLDPLPAQDPEHDEERVEEVLHVPARKGAVVAWSCTRSPDSSSQTAACPPQRRWRRWWPRPASGSPRRPQSYQWSLSACWGWAMTLLV